MKTKEKSEQGIITEIKEELVLDLVIKQMMILQILLLKKDIDIKK